MANDVLMVRIYLSEADHGRRKTLMREIFSVLHDRHAVQGVTVFRGVAGFGASGEVHVNDILRLTVDLPLVIEFFDEPEVAEAAIHLLESVRRNPSAIAKATRSRLIKAVVALKARTRAASRPMRASGSGTARKPSSSLAAASSGSRALPWRGRKPRENLR